MLRLFIISLIICFSLSQTIAIKAGNLIDPSSGDIETDQVILIENDKITAIGKNLDISKAGKVIDLSDAYVMPGLMDAHAHMALAVPPFQPINSNFEIYYFLESTTYRAFKSLKNAQEILASGFTTIRDVGNEANYALTDLRKAIDGGMFRGPTIFSAGKIIAAFGGQSSGMSPEQLQKLWRFEYIDADSPDEIRKAVRENLYYGANVIKLVADNDKFFYTTAEVKAAVDEAARAGYTVAVHVNAGQAADNVIAAKPASIEHGTYLTDKQLEAMKDNGIVLVGTDFPEEQYRAMGAPVAAAKAKEKAVIDRLGRADKIGVKMAFGTDVVANVPGKTRGEMTLAYLDIWKKAGVANQKILKCMTINVAELLRIEKERGLLKTGYYADIVASPKNPYEDIMALKNIKFVMKNGVVVRND